MGVDLKKLEVLSYEQELIILNNILEKKDLHSVAMTLKLSLPVVDQVAWKYKDVLALLISDREIHDKIDKVYNETLDDALKANQKAIKLLSRQINILYDEYFSEVNENIIMKDYLINQIISISDKLQKMIDTNYTQFRDNRKFLSDRVAGFKISTDAEAAGDYENNNQSVFDKISKLKGLAKPENPGAATIAYSFDLYDTENGEDIYIGHFSSAKQMAEAGYGERGAITRGIKRRMKDKNYRYKNKYDFRNIKKGY